MSRRPPLLSGVVVAQDNERTLPAVLHQLGRVADEIVLVDGGSRDATPDLALATPGLRFFHRPFTGNIAEQKNFALDQALGDWILILDTDELLSDPALRVVPWLVRTPGLSWVKFSRCWLVEDDQRIGHLVSRLHFPDFQLRLFRNRRPFRYDLARSPVHHNFPKAGRGIGLKLRRRPIMHFDFLLNDRAAREAKVERYRLLDSDSESTHAMYLWEDFPGAELRPLPAASDHLLGGRLERHRG
ncbi:MAG: glycosyltransferase [Planctomycetota bacterium]|nr:MAG: glycosyltransferase [Planctomycetota bacterium]